MQKNTSSWIREAAGYSLLIAITPGVATLIASLFEEVLSDLGILYYLIAIILGVIVASIVRKIKAGGVED